MKNNDVLELGDPKFIANLASLTDLTNHMNTLSLRLQGHEQVITDMYDCVKSFILSCKLTLWSQQLVSGNLAHFKTLQSVDKVDEECLEEYRDIVSNVQNEFDQLFEDFESMEKEFALFSTPFTMDMKHVSEEFQMELLVLQCDRAYSI
jgi:ABC-type phosphate transport system auxiliary subunit